MACKFEGEAVAVGGVLGGIEIEGEAESFAAVADVVVVAFAILQDGYKSGVLAEFCEHCLVGIVISGKECCNGVFIQIPGTGCDNFAGVLDGFCSTFYFMGWVCADI